MSVFYDIMTGLCLFLGIFELILAYWVDPEHEDNHLLKAIVMFVLVGNIQTR